MRIHTKLLAAAGLGTLMAVPFEAALAQVDELIVTARKREESILDTPVAVSAYGQDSLNQLNVTNVDELARFVPGLIFEKSFGRTADRPVIRGAATVGTPDFGVESGVSIFVDNVYFNDDVSGFGFFDLERIEVVRGPQSALYGRNTYSGAINLISRQPNLEEFEGSAQFRGAEQDEYEGNIWVTGPIVPGRLGVLVAGRYYEYGGFFKDSITGQDIGEEKTEAFKVRVRLDLDSFRAQAGINYAFDEDGVRPIKMLYENNCEPGARGEFGPGTDQYYCGNLFEPSFAAYDPTVLGDDGVDRQTWFYTLNMEWDLPGGYTIVSNTGMRDTGTGTLADVNNGVRADGTLNDPSLDSMRPAFISAGPGTGVLIPTFGPFPAPPGEFIGIAGSFLDREDWSQELKIVSPVEDRFRWELGGYYYYFDEDFVRDIGPLGNTGDDFNIRTWAIFGLAEYDFTEQFTASLELRYQDEVKSRTNLSPALSGNPAAFGTFEASFEEVLGRLILEYDVNENINIYGSVARANKPGGVNNETSRNIAALNPDQSIGLFQEELAWNYEIGIKSQWFDDRLGANVAVFFSDIEDIQLTESIDTALCGGVFGIQPCAPGAFIDNKDAAEILGVEVELFANPIEGWDFNVNYAFTDAEITKGNDINELRYFGQFDISGRTIPRTARHQLSVSTQYSRPLFNSGVDYYVGGNYSYLGKQFVQVHNRAIIPESHVVGVNFGIRNERFNFKVFGKNVFDEDAPVGGLRFIDTGTPIAAFFPNIDGSGNQVTLYFPRSYEIFPRRPSQWGAELTVNF